MLLDFQATILCKAGSIVKTIGPILFESQARAVVLNLSVFYQFKTEHFNYCMRS
jgi:hypothetical protein